MKSNSTKCDNVKPEPTLRIAELFAEKEQQIFNSNPSNKSNIKTLMSDLHSEAASGSGIINHAVITNDEVSQATNDLKNIKHNDDCIGSFHSFSP